jgi:hypothetical protein
MEETIKGIECYPNSKIYIFCPAGYATGGPEALHQLGYHLRQLGFNAYMYYFKIQRTKDITHKDYLHYQVPVADVLENKPEHIMILAEAYLQPIFDKKFSSIRKIIWWLSVTNYYIFQKLYIDKINRKPLYRLRNAIKPYDIASIERIKQEGVLNIGHSYFSMVNLRENGIEPIGQISDYMNDAFFELAKEEAPKEDIVIYNPRKNDEFLQEIISLTTDLKWVPIENMTPKEVAGWMRRAKVYIDFGYHPGKERMPREACIMKCCMVIGKTGSAAYQPDMPIPEKYRFEKSQDQIPGIIQQLKNCLTNYNEVLSDFEPYRKTLYREKEKFISDIQSVFVKV